MRKFSGAAVTIAAVCCLSAMCLVGCSMSDFTEKFVGQDGPVASSDEGSEDSGDAAAQYTDADLPEYVSGQAVDIEEYNPLDYVTLGEYKGVEVDCRPTEEEIQSEIDMLLESNPKQVKTGTAKEGMKVNIDYSGKHNGKKFDGGTAEGVSITLGDSGMIDGFDEGIIGMKVGEKKDVELTFPEEYPNDPDLAGEKTVFTMKLNYIEEDAVLDDAFVKENTEYNTVAEYKDSIKKELTEANKASVSSEAMKIALDNAKVSDVPKTLLVAEREMTRTQMEAQLQQYGMTLEDMLAQSGQTAEQYEENLLAQARSMAESELILEAIGVTENIDTSQAAVDAYLDEMLQTNGTDIETVKQSYKNVYGDAMPFERYIKESLLYTKVAELVGNAAKILE